jgi:hypothetical protein
MCDHHRVDEQELKAVVAARKELGPDHDEHLVAGFVDKIEKEIDKRVDAKLATPPRRRGGSTLHPANLAICIPIIAIAGGIGKTPGLIVAFVALALVFLVSELRR